MGGRVGNAVTPPRPQRGTSPSPRVVFDRATLTEAVLPGIAIGVLSRRIGAWIPAGAGMTNGGWIGECETGDMRALSGSSNTIFVPIDHPGWGRHTKV